MTKEMENVALLTREIGNVRKGTKSINKKEEIFRGCLQGERLVT